MVKYIFLGVVQGLTEFFPVSSSGHLVILDNIFGLGANALVLTVVLHLGTSLALIVFFFKDILQMLRSIKFITLIAITTVITGIIGLTFKDFFESLFNSPKLVACAMLVTAVILFLTRKFMMAKKDRVSVKDAAILGFTQAIAIIPGISRSGITISTLLFRKVDRDSAFRFSFLVSIPVVLGAALLEAKDIKFSMQSGCIAGFIASFLAGLLALYILKSILHRAKFYYFGYYCVLVALLTLLFIK